MSNFEQVLTNIMLQYPALKKVDREHIIAQLAIRDLNAISMNLDRKEYEATVLGIIEHYPTPFYQAAHRSIIATDIVTEEDSYWPREHWEKMIELNRDAVSRMKASNPDSSIRRIFIMDEKLSDQRRTSTTELMKALSDIGVNVRHIPLGEAAKRIANEIEINRWREVRTVEDFSVFDASGGAIKYAGRFKNPTTKRVIISTDANTIKELEQQFEILWKMARPFAPVATGAPLERPGFIA